MILIGIDPSFRENGFAVVIIDEAKEVQGLLFKGFSDFVEWLNKAELPSNAIVGIENSNLQNTSFDTKGNKGQVARKSRNVGANQAASQYTVDYCRFFFGEGKVFEISPKDKGGKYTQAGFRQIVHQENHSLIGTKWGQDKRDAYKIALIAYKRYMMMRARIIQQ